MRAAFVAALLLSLIGCQLRRQEPTTAERGAGRSAAQAAPPRAWIDRRVELEAELARLEVRLLEHPDDEAASARRLAVAVALRDIDEAIAAWSGGARFEGVDPVLPLALSEEKQKREAPAKGEKGEVDEADPLGPVLRTAENRIRRAREDRPRNTGTWLAEEPGTGGANAPAPPAANPAPATPPAGDGPAAPTPVTTRRTAVSLRAVEREMRRDDAKRRVHKPADSGEQRMAAMVKDTPLSPAHAAEIHRQVQRAAACIPAGAARSSVTVRATLMGGRLAHPEVRSDPALAPAVQACIIDTVTRLRLPGIGGSGSRFIDIPLASQ